MTSFKRRHLDESRANAGPVANTLIDEFADGVMDRTDFIRRASVLGLSVPLVGATLAALGAAPLTAGASTRAGKAGGRLRLGIVGPPAGAVDPHLFNNHGHVVVGGVTGEYLIRGRQKTPLVPELALKWTPNASASKWTYNLRPNVKFQTGKVMNADDVVATYKRLTDPKSGSQALSAFGGVLTPEGVTKIDDLTVEFALAAPNANFPYLTSSTTYQAIILPADYVIGTFTTTPQTTGAFKLTSYTPGVGVKYDRFDGWWGGTAPLDGVDATIFDEDGAASVAAMLAGSQDLLSQMSLIAGRPLLKNPNIKMFTARGASHRTISMRVDRAPFKDFRVRQALALSFDRPALLKTVLGGFGDIGNDSPFAPLYASTSKSVPQRHIDLAKAKQLLAAAGHAKGFSATLTGINYLEVPQLAQVFQGSLKKIGVNLKLKLQPASVYYGGSAKTTPWLNAPMELTDWGHRAVPNVVANSSLTSKGVWNGSKYKSTTFDGLLKSYVGAISLADQRKYSKKLQELLLHDTPVIFPYFNGWLMPGSPKLQGFEASPDAQTYLSKASFA
jgi:peptide/nickel transport system substrate-binding protein